MGLRKKPHGAAHPSAPILVRSSVSVTLGTQSSRFFWELATRFEYSECVGHGLEGQRVPVHSSNYGTEKFSEQLTSNITIGNAPTEKI
ncbi:hypothetical protein OPQ81_001208 [Rhizoctonia solani]|nr:hypothetical protein OPQ81_001208 [Rhizoctonia solani]